MDPKTEDILSLMPLEFLASREEELQVVLNEVRNEIEENEMVHGIPHKVPRLLSVLSMIIACQ